MVKKKFYMLLVVFIRYIGELVKTS